MKQQDIAALILIVGIAALASFFLSTKLITPSDVKLSAEEVAPITTEFPLPDSKIFNDEAINPTVKIEIAPNENPNPFTNGN